jgi:hypothetical protein
VDRLIASFDQSGFGGIRNDLGVDLVASFEQTEDDGLAAGSLPPAPRPHLPRTRRGPKYDSSASTSPWNGELRSQASATLFRILRKIVFTDRTEMPVMRRFVSPSDPTQNNEPDAGIALHRS